MLFLIKIYLTEMLSTKKNPQDGHLIVDLKVYFSPYNDKKLNFLYLLPQKYDLIGLNYKSHLVDEFKRLYFSRILVKEPLNMFRT